jgi:hypothetical protein
MKIFVSAVFVLTMYSAGAQVKTYEKRIQVIHNNIYKYFYLPDHKVFLENLSKQRANAYLWPVCALLQAEFEFQKIYPKSNRFQQTLDIIDLYYTNRPPLPAFQASQVRDMVDQRYYDDNEWLALTFLDVYEHSKNKVFLDRCLKLYAFLQTGLDQKLGGGLYWAADERKSKNTCSNAPFIILSLRLYGITKDRKYIRNAKSIYDWVNSHLRSKNGLFYDSINTSDNKINEDLFSYNSGLMMEANSRFFQATRQKVYLVEAEKLARLIENHFYNLNILQDDYWFSAVLLRNFLQLSRVTHKKITIDFLIRNANRVWKEEKDHNYLIGMQSEKKLIDQAAMLEIYARLQEIHLKANLVK